MGSKLLAYVVLLSSICIFGAAGANAQQKESSPFLRSLSFEWYGQAIFGSYYGYATGGRFGVAAVKAPMLNRIFSARAEASDDLLVLPGLKIGSAHRNAYAYDDAVQIVAPELALHYPLLRLSLFGIYAGPSIELMYTNNSTRYLVVPSVGVDLGLTAALSQYVSMGVEHRWIVTKTTENITNVADFPREKYSYAGITLRFSLPWQSEARAQEQLRAADEKYQSLASSSDAELRKKIREYEFLVAANIALKNERDSTVRTASAVSEVKSEDIDRYDAAVKADDPEYLFTRDPFKNGDLVNDPYLKNVLIDIIDDAYVWQISAKAGRRGEAERIRSFFSVYNPTLVRRLVIAPDETVRTFKLKCLGRATGNGSGTKKK